MSRFDRDDAPEGPVVSAFVEGGFRVEGTVYPAVLLTPSAAQAWAPPPLADLTADDVGPLLELHPPPEFLLLGTGARLARPPKALREALEARKIGIEAMDSRAAARTWGLLRGEHRWIAAALLPL